MPGNVNVKPDTSASCCHVMNKEEPTAQVKDGIRALIACSHCLKPSGYDFIISHKLNCIGSIRNLYGKLLQEVALKLIFSTLHFFPSVSVLDYRPLVVLKGSKLPTVKSSRCNVTSRYLPCVTNSNFLVFYVSMYIRSCIPIIFQFG